MARIKPQALLQQSKKKKQPSRISATTILFGGLIVLLALFFLYSTYTHRSIRSSIQRSSSNSGFEDGSMMSGLKKSDVPGYVIFTTSKGPVTVELYKDSSPEIVDKFIDLCQKGHFKGMQFVRVIKHYVIQAGSTDNLGNTEDWTVKGKHHGQLHASMKHEAFMVGTSKGKQDDKGFDLFITTAPIPDLSEKLVVFGRVVKGEDVVQEIEEVDTDEHYRPKSQIGIISVTLKQKA
uniref:Peptidyl-prolyl cis-trans isomerase n=1 Tax=Linum usitatissimum TaxID=4006 RepID=A0A165G110_LINUS|nr:peptidyl-prolyl cis-trans isomerase- peptidyl-prolyl cis-trans isomerase activity, protein folding [Linum usitatissimum]